MTSGQKAHAYIQLDKDLQITENITENIWIKYREWVHICRHLHAAKVERYLLPNADGEVHFGDLCRLVKSRWCVWNSSSPLHCWGNSGKCMLAVPLMSQTKTFYPISFSCIKHKHIKQVAQILKSRFFLLTYTIHTVWIILQLNLE